MEFIAFNFHGTDNRTDISAATSDSRGKQALAPLYPVVDSLMLLEALLKAGVTTVQLRIKDADDPQLEAKIKQAIALGKQYQAQVVINDYWQLALTHGAFAVHLGQEDLPNADLAALAQANIRLGVSTRTLAELEAAIAMKPSYLAIGHIFPTPTKQMKTPPQGLAQLKRHVDLVAGRVPTVAIGGIDLAKAPQIWATGVDSIAVVRAVTQSTDLTQTLDQFSQVFSVEYGVADVRG